MYSIKKIEIENQHAWWGVNRKEERKINMRYHPIHSPRLMPA